MNVKSRLLYNPFVHRLLNDGQIHKSYGVQSLVIYLIYAFLAFIWLFISIEAVTRLFVQDLSLETTVILKDFLVATLAAGSMIFLYKRVHQSVVSNEEQYKKLFTKNPHPMWIYDLSTLRFIKVNDAAIALYGYSEK